MKCRDNPKEYSRFVMKHILDTFYGPVGALAAGGHLKLAEALCVVVAYCAHHVGAGEVFNPWDDIPEPVAVEQAQPTAEDLQPLSEN